MFENERQMRNMNSSQIYLQFNIISIVTSIGFLVEIEKKLLQDLYMNAKELEYTIKKKGDLNE